MASRTAYDTCAYSKALAQSTAPIDYVLNPMKYEHCRKCRIELGIVGGTAVSHIGGNLVDLENDLFNINRAMSRCPDYQHHPPERAGEPIVPTTDPILAAAAGRTQNKPIKTQARHLRPCQMVAYAEVPHAPHTKPYRCG